MTLYFEPWQLVAVCVLTVIGAAVVALVVVGLLGAWLFRDRGSVQVARAVAEPTPAGVRLHAVHDRDTCDACAGRDRGSF